MRAHRALQAQPEAETEELELPQVSLDTAVETPPNAADIPTPEENDVLLVKAKAKEGKGSKELRPKDFDNQERQSFDPSDAKELQAWKDAAAYEELSEKEIARGATR